MPRSHGTGAFEPSQFAAFGNGVVLEPGVLVFHPETISIGDDVYVGHQTILKGYFKGRMEIGRGSWIGQQCFLHSAGGIVIGERVGIGPKVAIVTSTHSLEDATRPIMDGPLEFAPVRIGDGADLGLGAIVLPGVSIGRRVQVGAGAVVTQDVPDGAVVVGVPARVVRIRRP